MHASAGTPWRRDQSNDRHKQARTWFGVVLCLLASVVAASQAPIVVVISMDGVRYDFPDRAVLPGFQRLEKQGVRARRLTPVFPSETFPGHVSMATGTYPDVHGIVGNHFRDQQKGSYAMSSEADWIEAEPLWIAAERQGIPTATYFWVGSETDWRQLGTRYRVAPFDNSRTSAVKVDQVLAWLDGPEPPQLIMTYWAGVDSVAHDQGPDHDDVLAELITQDRELQRLMQGFDERDLWQRLTLLVVSDHGMAETGELIDAQAALEDAGIPARISGYASAQVYLDNPEHAEYASRVLEDLPHTTVWPTNALPPEWRLSYPGRSGDLMITTQPPYMFASVGTLEGWLWSLAYHLGWRRGGHGYDPALKEMGGIFYAIGRGVPGGRRLGEVHQIDVAPTVSLLLGIDPPAQAEGRSVFSR